jgi:hypothetical protein
MLPMPMPTPNSAIVARPAPIILAASCSMSVLLGRVVGLGDRALPTGQCMYRASCR